MTTDAAELARRLAELNEAYGDGVLTDSMAAHLGDEIWDKLPAIIAALTRLETAERERDEAQASLAKCAIDRGILKHERDEALSRLAEADALVAMAWGKQPRVFDSVDEMRNALDASFARHASRIPERCPACNSPRPDMHPAMQHEGEVQICHNPWHASRTPAQGEGE